jgi:transcriptional regulator with XRE-family HTH domain
MTQKRVTAIPQRQKCVNIEEPYVAGTEDIIDDEKGKTQEQINKEVDDTLALHQSEINALDSQNYVTVSAYASLPVTGSVDTVYRVSSWDGSANSGAGAVDATKYSEYAWDGSDYKLLDVKTAIGEVFDISEYNNDTYDDLADALGTNKQTVNKMLNGSRMINAVELKSIAKYLGVKMEDLTKITAEYIDPSIVHVFMGKVQSEQAKQALQIADELSDMILFHKRVRENGNAMMVAWEDD